MSDEPLQEILLTMGGNTINDANKMNAHWDDSNDVAEEKYVWFNIRLCWRCSSEEGCQ